MSMSKKDFIALADALKADTRQYETVEEMHEGMIDALCAFMRGQNSQFKEDRWRAYLRGECGPSGGAVKGAR